MHANRLLQARCFIQLLTVLVLGFPAGLLGQSHQSEYAGEQTRRIKSLSPADIDQLQRGAGWGLAKAAELNGVPGPLHLLEMKQEINLSEAQIESIEKLFLKMQTEAIRLGEQLIELELALEQRFRGDLPEPQELEALLDDIGKTRSALRFVHLSAHLETPEILSHSQIALYNELRGYETDDPCASVPKGHDPDMWRAHNNCQ